MTKPLIQVIIGSTRDVRVGKKVADWFMTVASQREDLAFELVDLKEWNLPFLNEPKLPSTGEYSMESTKKWSDKIAEADGYVIVTPEYNHAPNAALTNALATIYNEWNKKPVAFVSYGGPSGGIRAVEQLRQIVVELQMAPLRIALAFPMVSQAFDEAGQPTNPMTMMIAGRMLDDLAWWTNALKTAHEATTIEN